MPAHYSPHSFQATGITNFLENDGNLEVAQRIAVIPTAGPQRFMIAGERKYSSRTWRGFELAHALREVLGMSNAHHLSADDTIAGDDLHTSFRRPEYRVLREARKDKYLEIVPASLDSFSDRLRGLFKGVYLIKKLRETRVLNGFTRIFPDNELDAVSRQRMLRKNPPLPGLNWLPAYVVFGEGIFIEMKDSALTEWENSELSVSRSGSPKSKQHVI